MVQASFTIPALEFNANFLAQIQPFLQSADIEVFVQVRQKTKRARKNGKLPAAPNGFSTLLPEIAATPQAEPFVKKYPLQPTPEESEKILATLTARPMQQKLDLEQIRREQNWTPMTQEEWFRRAEALNIDDPIEELLALLTK